MFFVGLFCFLLSPWQVCLLSFVQLTSHMCNACIPFNNEKKNCCSSGVFRFQTLVQDIFSVPSNYIERKITTTSLYKPVENRRLKLWRLSSVCLRLLNADIPHCATVPEMVLEKNKLLTSWQVDSSTQNQIIFQDSLESCSLYEEAESLNVKMVCYEIQGCSSAPSVVYFWVM